MRVDVKRPRTKTVKLLMDKPNTLLLAVASIIKTPFVPLPVPMWQTIEKVLILTDHYPGAKV